MRKPEPLGTEFKCLVDGMTGNMIWLEICEGKERMKNKEFVRELGATSSCVMRGSSSVRNFDFIPDELDATDEADTIPSDTRKRLWMGDSWFGSVRSAANLSLAGQHCIMQVKTAHSRFPKSFLDEKMKDYPGGTWITMEGTTELEGQDLVAIGYKYNKKTVLSFVCTRGAGGTEAGKPYEATFPDKYGNVCTRYVARPHVVSQFFTYSNCVDVHNQARQFELALEKSWVTHEAYFRLYTTMLGMIVTNVWKMRRSLHSKIPIIKFADELAYEMIQRAKGLENIQQERSVQLCLPIAAAVMNKSSSVSSMSMEPSLSHTKLKIEPGKQVRCIWCSRVHLVERKSSLKCLQCGKGFCREESGRSCWALHVAHGGVPGAPKKGTKKRKPSDMIECSETVNEVEDEEETLSLQT